MSPFLATPQTLLGELLGGKYRVSRVIGRGGMGTVFLVHHEELDQSFAIKVLLGEAANDSDSVARFMREARAAAKLQSEHVVRVSDVGTFEAVGPYMVMEYLNGTDLGKLVATRGPLPVKDAIDYVLEAVDAIAEAHSIGIVHRDVKPSNLFLATLADGRQIIKVLDFGISKVSAVWDSETQQQKLTATGVVLGSPAYMSPEQLKNPRDVDARADIWSLGVVVYELLAGVLPFHAETAGGMFAKVVSEDPDPLTRYRREVPRGLEAAILRCLRRNPRERHANVGEFAAQLAPFGSGRAAKEVARAQQRMRTLVETSPGTPADLLSTLADHGQAKVRSTQGSWTGASHPPRPRWGVAVVATLGVGLALGGVGALVHFAGARAPAAAASSIAAPPGPEVTAPSTVATPSSSLPVAPSATASAPPAAEPAPAEATATVSARAEVSKPARPPKTPRPVPPKPPPLPSVLDNQH